MEMTSEQFQELIKLLTGIAGKMSSSYTITGASDWPIILTCCGIFGTFAAFAWRDLRNCIKENKVDWTQALNDHRDYVREELTKLWSELRK